MESGIPLRRVKRVLSSLLEQLPEDQPISALHITSDGDSVVVKEEKTVWDDAARLPRRSGRRFAGTRRGQIIQQGEADQHGTYTTSTESPRQKEADTEDDRSVERDRLGEPRGIPPTRRRTRPPWGTGLRRGTTSRRR